MDRAAVEAYIKDNEVGQAALKLIGVLNEAGYEAWLVGGFVRDALLQRKANDADIATDALWQNVQKSAASAGYKTFETGVTHGTLTVLVPLDESGDAATAIEVTTYRSDGAYLDGRHPKEVTFESSIEKDLARRDFTINAIAYNAHEGLLDPFNGINDIANRIIRTVGNPLERFKEDGLRILRACRLASQLGFSIDVKTLEAMKAGKSNLRHVSTERITHELDLFLQGDFIHDALMQCCDVVAFAMPELVAMRDCAQITKYHEYDVLEHTAWVLQNSPADRMSRWAALAHDMGKPAAAFFDEAGVEHFYGHACISVQIARAMLKRYLMSQSFIEDVCTLVKYHDDVIAHTERSVIRMLQKLNGRRDLFSALLNLKRADRLSQAEEYRSQAKEIDELWQIFESVIENEDATCIKDLAIGGKDLIDMGFAEGPPIGTMLANALDAVIDGKVPNEHDALVAFVTANNNLE